MSCNGCRVLRKGCSDTCILRPCLQWIESSDAQGYATVFVAKFFGRAGLMSFISAVPESQRPALFLSLLYEACGRTVNPVFGSVGLLWGGNWQTCQAAVETILTGGSLRTPSVTSMSSSCLGFPAPIPAPSPMSAGKFSTPASAKVNVPTHMPNSLSLDRLADVDGNRHYTSLRSGMPETSGREPTDYCDGWNKATRNGGHQESVFKKDVNECPTWFKDKKLENGIRHPKLLLEIYDSEHKICKARRREFVNVHLRRVYEEPPVPALATEQLELDLTLKVKGGKGGQLAGNKRLNSSPCDSVNSEGSVTSLDSTPRGRLPSWTVETGRMPPPLRRLLPLLQ